MKFKSIFGTLIRLIGVMAFVVGICSLIAGPSNPIEVVTAIYAFAALLFVVIMFNLGR